MSEDDNAHRALGRGMYEVWFLTFTDRSSGIGYWIRSSYHSPRRGPDTAGVWFARFDPADPEATFGIHRSSSAWSLDARTFDVRIGDTRMSSGRAEGSVRGGEHEARWSLAWETGQPTYRLLPPLLYRGAIAPTKPLSPNVDTAFTGQVTVDGQTLHVAGAPGQQGHLYGTRHAERWAWAHCGDFLGEDAVVHAVTAQGRRGPILLPFVTSVGVRWRGRWIRLGKLSARRDFGLGMWRVDLENRRYRLTGRIEAAWRAMLRARYQDPGGRPRYCHNSEIASCRLALFERRRGGFEELALLESRGTTHAEWAGRTPAAAVPREFVEVGG